MPPKKLNTKYFCYIELIVNLTKISNSKYYIYFFINVNLKKLKLDFFLNFN